VDRLGGRPVLSKVGGLNAADVCNRSSGESMVQTLWVDRVMLRSYLTLHQRPTEANMAVMRARCRPGSAARAQGGWPYWIAQPELNLGPAYAQID